MFAISLILSNKFRYFCPTQTRGETMSFFLLTWIYQKHKYLCNKKRCWKATNAFFILLYNILTFVEIGKIEAERFDHSTILNLVCETMWKFWALMLIEQNISYFIEIALLFPVKPLHPSFKLTSRWETTLMGAGKDCYGSWKTIIMRWRIQ